MTLALFEDSGWYYDINYKKSKHLDWGYRKGCEFVENRCNASWPRGEGYFCTVQGEEGCSYDRKAYGSCDLRSWMSIPPKFQYFDKPHVGGPIEYADFCPFTNPEFYCDQSAAASDGKYGDSTGSSSRCFLTTLTRSVDEKLNPQKPLCYPHHCWSSTDYAIQVGSYWYACGNTIEKEKTLSNILSYNGSIICANSSILCSTAEDDPEFPIFISVEPKEVESGSKIRIKGRNLGKDTEVALGATCESRSYKDNTIECTVVGKVSGKKNIILKQNGYSLVIPDAFKLKDTYANWIQTNWFFAICIGLSAVVLVAAAIIIIIKCCTTSKKWKKYQKSKQDAANRQNAAAQNAAASRNEFAGDVEFDTMA